MLALTILSVFILLVIAIITFEIKNERKYQEKRRKRRKKDNDHTRQKFPDDPIVTPSKRQVKTTSKKDPQKSTEKKTETKEKVLPRCTYPKFTHVRLVDMGLSDKEAKEFVEELIPQIEAQIPLIEKELAIPDFHQMERLTHSLKGSATNLGTGGISDLLVECNTYLKTGKDIDIASAYFGYLEHYTQELKEQYA